MSDYEIRYSTKDIADMLGIEAVTVRKYALALKRAGYVINRSDGKNRSYSERDAMAFKFLQSIRARTSVTVEEAAMVTVQRGKTDMVTAQHIERNEGEVLQVRYDGRYDILASEMLKIRTNIEAVKDMNVEQTERLNRIYALSERYEQMVGFQKELMQQLQQLGVAEHTADNRLERVNEQLLEHSIRTQLREKALAKWHNKPERERTVKAGWFKRVENEAAREIFVRTYIDDNYEAELKKAYGMEP
ncbi:hypothetical protein ACFPYJ_09925 [Paenibacillus solisilvae]|uniref:HTH merR-type domain-containing protein n=1 Tax=Paenibacillus solisilvae TaxID=2486751 RepID=A0ABW0VV20_9BACL